MIVPEHLNGQRLDVSLCEHKDCKGFGLRARKRLCEEGFVFVNSFPQKAQYKVKLGQHIEIIEKENFSFKENILDTTKIFLEEYENYYAFYKPACVPTIELKGLKEYSLERFVHKKYPEVLLLNRLDYETSGIIFAAKNQDALFAWKDAQEQGNIHKEYIALVEGIFDKEQCIDSKIDLKKTKVRAIPYSIDENIRHTYVKPLFEHEGNTYVHCRIFKGVRHQIRSHLASIGFPLVGDNVYSPNNTTENFFLHHFRLQSPFISLLSAPQKEQEKHLFAWEKSISILKPL